jgi:hypothetical protein
MNTLKASRNSIEIRFTFPDIAIPDTACIASALTAAANSAFDSPVEIVLPGSRIDGGRGSDPLVYEMRNFPGSVFVWAEVWRLGTSLSGCARPLAARVADGVKNEVERLVREYEAERPAPEDNAEVQASEADRMPLLPTVECREGRRESIFILLETAEPIDRLTAGKIMRKQFRFAYDKKVVLHNKLPRREQVHGLYPVQLTPKQLLLRGFVTKGSNVAHTLINSVLALDEGEKEFRVSAATVEVDGDCIVVR